MCTCLCMCKITCACMYQCICTCMRTCMCQCMCVYTRVYVNINVHAHVCVYVDVQVCIPVHVCAYVYVYGVYGCVYPSLSLSPLSPFPLWPPKSVHLESLSMAPCQGKQNRHALAASEKGCVKRPAMPLGSADTTAGTDETLATAKNKTQNAKAQSAKTKVWRA